MIVSWPTSWSVVTVSKFVVLLSTWKFLALDVPQVQVCLLAVLHLCAGSVVVSLLHWHFQVVDVVLGDSLTGSHVEDSHCLCHWDVLRVEVV